jgi:hypothetical protein
MLLYSQQVFRFGQFNAVNPIGMCIRGLNPTNRPTVVEADTSGVGLAVVLRQFPNVVTGLPHKLNAYPLATPHNAASFQRPLPTRPDKDSERQEITTQPDTEDKVDMRDNVNPLGFKPVRQPADTVPLRLQPLQEQRQDTPILPVPNICVIPQGT